MKQISWHKTEVEAQTGYIIFVGNRSIGHIIIDASGYWDIESHSRHSEKLLSALCRLWNI